jgi:acetyltransferase-like isoleucine patch superfamily enzyme
MPHDECRELHPTPEAEEVFKRWLVHLDDEFTKHKKASLRGELVRDALHQLYLGRPHGGKLNFTLTTELPSNVLQLTLDPANVTIEGEYDVDVDVPKYCERKPLIWFWQMFDRSPVGLNHWLGFRFRAMLGRHIFKSIGKNVKIFGGVEFTFGYNLSLEDDVIIHKHAVIDDRREIILPKGTVIDQYGLVSADRVPSSQNATLRPHTNRPTGNSH